MRSPLAREAPPEPLARRLGLLFVYLLVGVAWTWPLALNATGAVIQRGGVPVDSGQGVWNIWWGLSALGRGANPYRTEYLFHPATLDLFYQTLSLPNSLLVAPVVWLGGPVAGFNALILASFALGGYWCYRVARAAGAGGLGAFAGGLLYVCSAYHMQRVATAMVDLAALQWIPLYILLLMRALARPTLWRALAAAIALLVTTLAAQYYGLFCALYTAGHVGLACLGASRREVLARLGVAIAIGVIWLVGLLPFVWPPGALAAAQLEDWRPRQVYHSVALVDLIALGNLHPLWGQAAGAWHRAVHPFGYEAGASPGFVAYALIAVALVTGWRRAWPWLALALGCLALALGPELRVTEAPTGIPAPFLLLDALSPFRNASRPANFVAVMLAPVAVLVALGFEGRGMRDEGRGTTDDRRQTADDRRQTTDGQRSVVVGRWSSVALIALLAFENLAAPWALTPLRAADGWRRMNSDPEPGAVLELPPRLNDGHGLLNQICQGRPLMGGYLARLPFYPSVSYPSATRALWLAEAPAPDIFARSAAAELASLGVRYVALDLTQLPRGARGRIEAWLEEPGIVPAERSETRALYVVDPAAARPTLTLGAGWYELERDGERRWRWMGAEAELRLLAREPAAVAVRLRATAYGAPRALQVRQGDALIATFEIPAAPRDQQIELRLLVPAGQTTLTLESPADAAPDGRSLSLSVSDIAISELPADGREGETLAIPPTLPAIGAAPCR